jgi:hypothetical protein
MNQLNYIAIYNIRGIGVSDTSRQFQVWNEGADRAYITKDLSPFVDHVDRGIAILHGVMKAIFKHSEDEIRSKLSSHVVEIQEERAKKYPSGTFLVFHGVKEAPPLDLQNCREGPDFSVAFDAFDKSDMRAKFWPAVVRSLTAVTVSLNDRADPRISKVTEGMYVTHPNSDKPTYSITITAGGARVSIGTMLDDSSESRILHYAKRLRDEEHIQKVLDQFVESLAKEKDEFRAFLAGWNALEIFVSSMFKRTYERWWFERLRSATPSSAQSYFDTVQDVMLQRHRLLDKFVVIASLLDPEAAEGDINQFKMLKKTRDDVFHGSDDANSDYPTDQMHQLLTKYLRLHLDRDVSSSH